MNPISGNFNDLLISWQYQDNLAIIQNCGRSSSKCIGGFQVHCEARSEGGSMAEFQGLNALLSTTFGGSSMSSLDSAPEAEWLIDVFLEPDAGTNEVVLACSCLRLFFEKSVEFWD